MKHLNKYKKWVQQALARIWYNFLQCFVRFVQRLDTGQSETFFLVRIGVIETLECWWGGAQEQTVIYLYSECPRWRRERTKPSRELGQHGISWQPRPERRLLGSFIGKRAGSWANTKVLERYTGW